MMGKRCFTYCGDEKCDCFTEEEKAALRATAIPLAIQTGRSPRRASPAERAKHPRDTVKPLINQ